jgi:hypothetical protein
MKLKFENTATIGDTIRAYDFKPMDGRGDCYLEGVVNKIVSVGSAMGGYRAFRVLVDRDVWNGEVETDSTRIGTFVFVPMETSRDFDGRVVNLTEMVAA